MSELWVEVWTRPGHATFGRVHDFVPCTGGFVDGLNKVGGGNLAVPSSWTGFDDVLYTDTIIPANSTSSLLRIYSAVDPTVPLFEWLPNNLVPPTVKEDPDIEITGVGMKGVLGYARLEPWDWDGTAVYAPKVPDWVFGGPDILQNGGFETAPFPNGGFEDGNNDYWQITQPDGFLTAAASIQAVNNPADAEAGDWYGLVDPISAKSGASRTFAGLIANTTYTITGFMFDPTASGDRFRAGISGAVSASHTNAYEEDGYWWAEVDNAPNGTGASDGTWQSFTLTFVASAQSIQLVVLFDDAGAGPTFRIDTWDISGDGVGLYPWEARYPERTATFEYQTATVHSGLGAAGVSGDDQAYTSPSGATGFGRIGIQQPVTLKVGQPYKAEVWVRQNSGSSQEFVLAIIRQSPLGAEGSPGSSYMANVVVSVPTGVWTLLSEPFVADVQEAWFYVTWRYAGAYDTGLHPSPLYFVDDAHLYEGLPKTTVGDILLQLYRDATTDHAGRVVWEDDANPGTMWLTPDFTASVDSNGNAWADTEIGIRLTMRMSYSQIMAEFANSYGYEYRVVPDDPELGTWLWQVYNPGTMMTDWTAAIGPAVQGGTDDESRSIRRFSSPTNQMVEGVARITARDEDAGLVTALGRVEAAILNREAAAEDGAAAAASEAVAAGLTGGQSFSYTFVDPIDEPGTDYLIGDLLNVVDPPEVVLAESRFVGLVVSFTPERVEWETQFGSVSISNADAVIADAVAGLVAKFEYPDQLGGGAPAVTGGGGGTPTIVVAASNATDLSKARADLICTGTADDLVIETAIAQGDRRVVLTEGDFYPADTINLEPNLHIEGMGWLVTTIHVPTGKTGFSGFGEGAFDVELSRFGIQGTGPTDNSFALGLGFTNASINNLWIVNIETGISLAANGLVMSSCLIAECAVAMSGDLNQARIFGNQISGTVDLTDVFDVSIIGNTFVSSCLEVQGEWFTVTGNEWRSGSGAGPALITLTGDDFTLSDNDCNCGGYNALAVTGGSSAEVNGNRFINCTGGLKLTGADSALIVGNLVGGDLGTPLGYLGEHGIELSGCTESEVQGNLIVEPGQDADNTFDGVILSGNSARCTVMGNRVIPGTTGALQTRYGVNDTAGCTDTVIVGNRLDPGGAAYGTAPISLAGTGTLVDWPADATYGDNFV